MRDEENLYKIETDLDRGLLRPMTMREFISAMKPSHLPVGALESIYYYLTESMFAQLTGTIIFDIDKFKDQFVLFRSAFDACEELEFMDDVVEELFDKQGGVLPEDSIFEQACEDYLANRLNVISWEEGIILIKEEMEMQGIR